MIKEINNNKIYYLYDSKNSDTLIVMLHGLTMSSELYPISDLAEYLYSLNYDILRFDFIGHGKSYGKPLDMTLEIEINDAKAMIDSYKDKYKKLIFIGHSQGGVIASYLAGIYNPYKVILLGPAFNLMDCFKNGDFFGKKIKENQPVHIWDMRLSYDYLKDTRKEDYYILKYHNEVTIIHGDKDRLCPLSYSIQFKAKYKNVHLEIIHGSDHEFYDFFDELKKKVGAALNE